MTRFKKIEIFQNEMFDNLTKLQFLITVQLLADLWAVEDDGKTCDNMSCDGQCKISNKAFETFLKF